MKKLLILSFVLFAVAFTGCKKDDPLDREKFIGSWTGTQTVVLKLNGVVKSTDTSATTETIDAGADANQILFAKNTDMEIKAVVNGSSFTIDKQTKYGNENGQLFQADYQGSGTLSQNNILTLSYTMDLKDGYIYTVTATLNKN